MLKAQRIDRIFEIIKENKYITVETLVNRLHYSPATIRRDLTHLAKLGLVVKSYGGVSINEQKRPSIIREHENTADKIKLCNSAQSLINDGDAVFVDGTTTTFFLHELLSKKKQLTVVTTNLKLAMTLGESDVKCYVTGGKVHDANFLEGMHCSDLLKKMRFDVAFFSCGIISPDGEVYIYEGFYNFYDTVMERCKKNVLLCDAHKFSDKMKFIYCDLSKFNAVISNGKFNENIQEKFPNVEFIV